jgi:hypothetical protein
MKKLLLAALAVTALATPALADQSGKLTLRCQGETYNNYVTHNPPSLMFVWPATHTAVMGSMPYRDVMVTPDQIIFPTPSASGWTEIIDRTTGAYYASNATSGSTDTGHCVEVTMTP